ncbi:hypothetical protein LZ31DRAFT_260037 [Colletotrichum somersetense]|nr:hypothetical protein LZ31DRAFT_260037 [Colletotrichum somersetense]
MDHFPPTQNPSRVMGATSPTQIRPRLKKNLGLKRLELLKTASLPALGCPELTIESCFLSSHFNFTKPGKPDGHGSALVRALVAMTTTDTGSRSNHIRKQPFRLVNVAFSSPARSRKAWRFGCVVGSHESFPGPQAILPPVACCCRSNAHDVRKWQFAERAVSDSKKSKEEDQGFIELETAAVHLDNARSIINTRKREALPSHRLSVSVLPGPRSLLGSFRAKVKAL